MYLLKSAYHIVGGFFYLYLTNHKKVNTMQKIVTSKQFSLKLRDFLKGALMAVLVPCLLVVQQSLDKGEFIFNWKAISMTAVGAFVSYLLKNFFDKPKVVITTTTNQKAEDKVKDLLKK